MPTPKPGGAAARICRSGRRHCRRAGALRECRRHEAIAPGAHPARPRTAQRRLSRPRKITSPASPRGRHTGSWPAPTPSGCFSQPKMMICAPASIRSCRPWRRRRSTVCGETVTFFSAVLVFDRQHLAILAVDDAARHRHWSWCCRAAHPTGRYAPARRRAAPEGRCGSRRPDAAVGLRHAADADETVGLDIGERRLDQARYARLVVDLHLQHGAFARLHDQHRAVGFHDLAADATRLLRTKRSPATAPSERATSARCAQYRSKAWLPSLNLGRRDARPFRRENP